MNIVTNAADVYYKYDDQGRLIAAYYENGRAIVYSYDAAGNRTETEVLLNGEYTEDTKNNQTYDLVVLPLIGGYVMPYNMGSGSYGGPELSETTGFQASLTHSAGSPLNLRTLANSNGYTGGHATITYTITSDILGPSGGGTPAVQTGNWPNDASVKLTLKINSGVKIYGGGGNGGSGGGASGFNFQGPSGFGGPGGFGGNGGDAIVMTEGLVIENSGTISGGYGGGGGGGSGYDLIDPHGGNEDAQFYQGGGGGGGFPNGLAGSPGGQNGTTSAGGAGGAGNSLKGKGGRGGDSTGSNSSHQCSTASGGGNTCAQGGGTGTGNGSSIYPGGLGGKPGIAIKTNGHTLECTGSGSGCP